MEGPSANSTPPRFNPGDHRKGESAEARRSLRMPGNARRVLCHGDKKSPVPAVEPGFWLVGARNVDYGMIGGGANRIPKVCENDWLKLPFWKSSTSLRNLPPTTKFRLPNVDRSVVSLLTPMPPPNPAN